MKVGIVGAGLFGCIAADVCTQAGHEVTIIDSKKNEAASQCAACLLKPSWLLSISPEKLKKVYSWLDSLYGMQKIQFTMNRLKTVDIDWVDPKKILNRSVIIDSVERIEELKKGVRLHLITGKIMEFDIVLVACGVWSFELAAPEFSHLMTTKVGMALWYDKDVEPKISVYAPYKQAIQFNIMPGATWFGDGSATILKNFDLTEAFTKTKARAKQEFRLHPNELHHYRVGYRPFVKIKPNGFYGSLGMKRVFISTGGGKNGTVIAVLNALKFIKDVEDYSR
jgi:glycine/D-amino acid oxidase-like deaminating enzyme